MADLAAAGLTQSKTTKKFHQNNAILRMAGRFAGSRCCRVFSSCFGVSMMCLGCEAKEFHIFCTLFYRFSHCQDQALERDRPQQRGKKECVIYQLLAAACGWGVWKNFLQIQLVNPTLLLTRAARLLRAATIRPAHAKPPHPTSITACPNAGRNHRTKW